MTKRIRIAVLMLLLALGTSSVMAMPDEETFTRYFTDDTLTTQCGYVHQFCSGGYLKNGCTTDYFTVTVISQCG